MDLFGEGQVAGTDPQAPLAARMRPRGLDDLVGQDDVVGPGSLLRRAIMADRLTSVILYGPPGSGKTSLAESIARTTEHHFERASGAVSNVADLKRIIAAARNRRQTGAARRTLLFIDEIHRFNKAQQDVLLPHVEDGTLTLIGATTHNPMFFVNAPLVSRSLVFQLRPLPESAVAGILARALADPRGFGGLARADDDALAHLARVSEGDARRALNALEVAVLSTEPGPDGVRHVTRAVAEQSIQKKMVQYDRDEDEHYDTISAFIKSIRGSDPDAAVYWLAKMLYAGEDPRFIARRLVISAAEDIGNADPRGLTLAVSAMEAAEFVGMPEARIILAQATTYLATAPKSNASYEAVNRALADVETGRVMVVPAHLRNLKLRTANAGPEPAEYQYPHAYDGHFVDQDYLPVAVRYFEPGSEGYEAVIAQRLAGWRQRRQAPEAKGGGHAD